MDRNQGCSFCGKSRAEVKKLIAGPSVFICDECVVLSGEVLNEEKKEDFLKDNVVVPSPKQIKAEFDKYVIGQDQAKKTLAVVVNNHYKQIYFQEENKDIEFGKSNLLMIGPTSSGKTLLMRVLKKILGNNVPVAFADATTLTEAGYVGDDVESVVLRLLQEADFNVEKAQKGIIFIDEIDKIALKAGSASITRDVSGEGVQQALLGLLQGKISAVSPQGGRKHPNQDFIYIDTTNILFVCCGAFSGLEKILEQKSKKSNVGFHGELEQKNISKSYGKVEPEDLVKFGMIPEFVGRLPVTVTLDELDEDHLVKVLKEPKNAILKQYEKIFHINNAKLIIKEEAIRKIAAKAIERKVGARGLRSIIENILQETMYNLEDNVPCNIIIDEEAAMGIREPIVEKLENHALLRNI